MSDLEVRIRDVVLPFRLVDAGTAPGSAFAAEFAAAWSAYRGWYLREGEQARPTYAESREAVGRHLPELLDDYDRAVEVVGGGDLEARLLSQWCPPPAVAACSIAMLAAPEPYLVRNYDYPPLLFDALALRTRWSGRAVLGMADLGLGLQIPLQLRERLIEGCNQLLQKRPVQCREHKATHNRQRQAGQNRQRETDALPQHNGQ